MKKILLVGLIVWIAFTAFLVWSPWSDDTEPRARETVINLRVDPPVITIIKGSPQARTPIAQATDEYQRCVERLKMSDHCYYMGEITAQVSTVDAAQNIYQLDVIPSDHETARYLFQVTQGFQIVGISVEAGIYSDNSLHVRAEEAIVHLALQNDLPGATWEVVLSDPYMDDIQGVQWQTTEGILPITFVEVDTQAEAEFSLGEQHYRIDTEVENTIITIDTTHATLNLSYLAQSWTIELTTKDAIIRTKVHAQ